MSASGYPTTGEMMTFPDEILAQLAEPPPESQLEERDMRDEGDTTTLTYLSHYYIRERLNEIFQHCWSHEVTDVSMREFGKSAKGTQQWAAFCTVTIRVWTGAGWVSHSERGAAITYGTGEKAIQCEKQAISDGIRRAAWNLGPTFQVPPERMKKHGERGYRRAPKTPAAAPPRPS